MIYYISYIIYITFHKLGINAAVGKDVGDVDEDVAVVGVDVGVDGDVDGDAEIDGDVDGDEGIEVGVVGDGGIDIRVDGNGGVDVGTEGYDERSFFENYAFGNIKVGTKKATFNGILKKAVIKLNFNTENAKLDYKLIVQMNKEEMDEVNARYGVVVSNPAAAADAAVNQDDILSGNDSGPVLSFTPLETGTYSRVEDIALVRQQQQQMLSNIFNDEQEPVHKKKKDDILSDSIIDDPISNDNRNMTIIEQAGRFSMMSYFNANTVNINNNNNNNDNNNNDNNNNNNNNNNNKNNNKKKKSKKRFLDD